MTGDGRFVVAIVRGDHDVNETKLVNAIKATGGMRPAQVDEIKARGMEAGYGSPIGARTRSSSWTRSPRARPTWSRRQQARLPPAQRERAADYTPDVIADLVSVREGDACPDCGKPVTLRNGIEVGNIFKLGPSTRRHSAPSTWRGRRAPSDRDGLLRHRPRRNVACIVEAHHDEKGSPGLPRWRRILRTSSPSRQQGPARGRDGRAAPRDRGGGRPDHEILYDDRDESPGVKFTDAELLGMPWIITSARGRSPPAASRSRSGPPASARSVRSRTSRRSSSGGRPPA